MLVTTEEKAISRRAKTPWALRSLPVMPQVAAELVQLLGDETTPLGKVADLIKRDPALAAEILRAANSSASAQRVQVIELDKAIVVLGTGYVKRIAWGLTLKSALPSSAGEHLGNCWRHSVASALIGEELAKVAGESAGLAFAACLLHDIGRLALLVCHSEECEELIQVCTEEPFDLLVCEDQLFDIDHCRAGQWLAEQWGLPAEFSHAAGHHHDSSPGDNTLVSTVMHACRFASVLGLSVIPRTDPTTIEELIAELSVADPAALKKSLDAVPSRIDQFMKALGS